MDEEYATRIEGNPRKRIKISRDTGRSVDSHASNNNTSEVISLVTSPARPPPPASAENGAHENGHPCHHEQSLHALHGDLEAMRQLITCKMCYRFVYEPYGLTCGHTFCYSCLTQWMANKKSCPDCRAVIKDQPIPSYLVRELVLIFANRSELLPDGETSEEHHQQAKEEAETVAKDKANKDIKTGGLFKGLFTRGSARNPLDAIRDESDNVWRCPQCMTELDGTYCDTCNIRVLTSDDDYLDWSTDSSDDDEELDGDLLDDEADVDFGLDAQGIPQDYLAHFGTPDYEDQVRFHRYINGQDYDGPDYGDPDYDADDLPSMDSFIDDGHSIASNAGATGSDNTEIFAPNRQPQAERVHVESSSSELGDEVEEDGRLDFLTALGQVSERTAATDVADDDDSDDEGPITASQRQRLHGRGGRVRSQPRAVAHDSDDEREATGHDTAGGFSPLQYGHVAGTDNSSLRHDDEDDSDGTNYAEYFQSATHVVSDPSDDDEDDDADDDDNNDSVDDHDEETQFDDDDDDDDDDDEHSESDEEGWGTTSTSHYVPERSYRHRLATVGPRRVRHIDRMRPHFHGNYPQRRSPARANATVPQTVAPRSSWLATPAAASRPVYSSHPFVLSDTLANVNHRLSRSRQNSRRQPSTMSNESSIGGGVNIRSSGSSGSSRTFRGED